MLPTDPHLVIDDAVVGRLHRGELAVSIALERGPHVIGVASSKRPGDGWRRAVPDRPLLFSPYMKASFEVGHDGQVVEVDYRPRRAMGLLMRGTLNVSTS